jgi:hypothetical protein
MADVKLKDLIGIKRTYQGVLTVRVPSSDGTSLDTFTKATEYAGIYNVVPTKVGDTLPTQDTLLISDVTISPIPVTEADNSAGGKTVTIAGTIYKITAGTYVSKNREGSGSSNYREMTIDNLPYIVLTGLTGSYTGLRVRYYPNETSETFKWLIGYPSGDSLTVLAFAYLGGTYRQHYWTIADQPFTITVTSDTVVSQSQKSVFDMYFTQSGN